MSNPNRPTRRRVTTAMALDMVDAAPATYRESNGYSMPTGHGTADPRAIALDRAATAFLKSKGKRGRTHKANYTAADRRAVRAGAPDLSTVTKAEYDARPVDNTTRSATRGGMRSVARRI